MRDGGKDFLPVNFFVQNPAQGHILVGKVFWRYGPELLEPVGLLERSRDYMVPRLLRRNHLLHCIVQH